MADNELNAQIVDAAIQDKPATIADLFNSSIKGVLADKIADLKVDTATRMFNTDTSGEEDANTETDS